MLTSALQISFGFGFELPKMDPAYWVKVATYMVGVLPTVFKIYAITIVCSLLIGMLLALGKVSKYRILRGIISTYTWIFRGTPLLLQLMLVYYGLPAVGIIFTQFQAAAITFTINYAAYFTEIFRGGIQSIDKGQYEAAKALGMNYRQTMVKIIIPQAIKRVLAPVSNEAITLVKDTALIYTIALEDILRAAKQMSSRDVTLSPYMIAGVFYLLLTAIVVFVFRHIEKKYSIYE